MSQVAVHHELTGPPGAPVLVLANSLGTTIGMWDAQLPALSERFRVLRYDLRGHGGTPAPVGPYTIGDLGADVLALLHRLGIDRASFCGLSLGGMVGMWVAAHAPEQIDRLVLCCTSAHLPPANLWSDRAAVVREHGTALIAESVVARWFTPAFRQRQPATVARIVGMLASTPREGYVSCCAAIEHMDLRPDLPAIRAPTLIIAGADDPASPPDHAYEIARLVPDARVVVLPQAAHLANVERPDAVTALVLEHLISRQQREPQEESA